MLTNVAKSLNSIQILRPPDPQCAVFDFKDGTTTFQLITEKSLEATPGVFWGPVAPITSFWEVSERD